MQKRPATIFVRPDFCLEIELAEGERMTVQLSRLEAQHLASALRVQAGTEKAAARMGYVVLATEILADPPRPPKAVYLQGPIFLDRGKQKGSR